MHFGVPIVEYVQAASDCALHFVTGPLPEQKFILDFLELGENVLGKDDWATWLLQTTSCDVAESPVFAQLARITCERAEQIRAFLQDVLSKVDDLRRQVDRLYHLALTLIVFAYKGFSTFLSQKRWFL